MVPGFVDSHTHLVFAGDRSAEFAARMAGQPYAAGGINVTVEATRAATGDELRRLTTARRSEARAAGITTVEIKSGYGLSTVDEARLLEVGRTFTPETTFLGAHVVPSTFAGRADEYVDLVCGEMLTAAAPHARWIDAFCEVGVAAQPVDLGPPGNAGFSCVAGVVVGNLMFKIGDQLGAFRAGANQ